MKKRDHVDGYLRFIPFHAPLAEETCIFYFDTSCILLYYDAFIFKLK
jgi:hypothetical protein